MKDNVFHLKQICISFIHASCQVEIDRSIILEKNSKSSQIDSQTNWQTEPYNGESEKINKAL